ncbi:hypothetical protein OQJ26_15095 [Legionella sp. PATHC038]|uniref:hypothetical protein n=1 Tax=Legionella sheltonii TaxID=2992041 RepID=UPI0022441610|nr:hypothetical protein [Legionella sp. PATHC038]MCW8400109.1 hypothetical protein [Legionella sp. PATHC038]
MPDEPPPLVRQPSQLVGAATLQNAGITTETIIPSPGAAKGVVPKKGMGMVFLAMQTSFD